MAAADGCGSQTGKTLGSQYGLNGRHPHSKRSGNDPKKRDDTA